MVEGFKRDSVLAGDAVNRKSPSTLKRNKNKN